MEYCDLNDTIDLTPKEKEIFINGIKYSVSINKSQNKNDSLIIKIFFQIIKQIYILLMKLPYKN